jgi:hypothetical protein
MSCLLYLSPVLLDQSFPRDEAELMNVIDALGEIESCISDGTAKIIVTEQVIELIDKFNWSSGNNSLLIDIYRFLSQLVLRQDDRIVDLRKYIDLFDNSNEYYSHPVPARCCNQNGFLNSLSDELGKIIFLHDKCIEDNFFIGLACVDGFSSGSIDEYINLEGYRSFPLICPENIKILVDAFIWDLPNDIHQKSVDVNNVKKNCRLIGGILEKPKGDSHYKIKFPGSRSWTFSVNDDPVPEKYLKELEDLTPYPKDVIKVILLTGEFPKKILRLEKI